MSNFEEEIFKISLCSDLEPELGLARTFVKLLYTTLQNFVGIGHQLKLHSVFSKELLSLSCGVCGRSDVVSCDFVGVENDL